MDGGTSYTNAGDRAGIFCRTVKDAVSVLDAIKGYEAKDDFRAIPKALIPKDAYATFLAADKDVKARPLKGLRIGIAREFMVKHTKNDNAISEQAARTKKIDSPVAGKAHILLVPDLEAGNMLAKQLQYLAGADAAGIVLGARVPIVLTSRADNVRARLASIAVMKLVAHARRAREAGEAVH